MKSSLTETLDKYSGFFLNLKEKYNIKLFHIINCGLILNAFALLNLFYNEFIVFIGLFALGYFTSVIEENYENKTTFEKYYSNLSLWIKMLSLYFFVSVIYYKKISYGIIFLVLSVLFLCSINYAIDYLLENKNIDLCHKFITFPFRNYSEVKLTRASRVMRNFDENMTMLYLLIIICVIYLI